MSKKNNKDRVKDIDLLKVDDSVLDKDDVVSAASELDGIASEFFLFGCALGIARGMMKQLQDNYRYKQRQGLQAVLDEYVLGNHDTIKFGHPTWRNIIAAVSNSMGGNNHRLAKKIAANHGLGTSKKVLSTEESSRSFVDVTMKRNQEEVARSSHDPQRRCSAPPTIAALPCNHPHDHLHHSTAPTPLQQNLYQNLPLYTDSQPHHTPVPSNFQRPPLANEQRYYPNPSDRKNVQRRCLAPINELAGSIENPPTSWHDRSHDPQPHPQYDHQAQQRDPCYTHYQKMATGVPPQPNLGTQPPVPRASSHRLHVQGGRECHDVRLMEAAVRKRMLGVNKPLATTPEDIPDSPTGPRGKFFPVHGRGRGRRGSRTKCTNLQPRRPGSNQGTPPTRPPLGKGSRTTSHEQSQASTAVGYTSEGVGQNSTICTFAAGVPSVPVSTTPVGNVTAKFDQIRVNQTPPKDTITRQLAGYTAPPPPQEQSRTPSESLTSFMSENSITESSLNSSTCSEPCFDDELSPNKFSKDLFKSSYSSKYSQHGMSVLESPCPPPEATLGDSHPIDPQPPLNTSPLNQPKYHSDVHVPFPRSQEYSATLGDSHPINPQPPLNTSPHVQPKYPFGVHVPFPRSQEYSAGAPPAILQQAANLPTAQASVTSDPTQSQFSTTQSYQTRLDFFEGQQDMSLATMDSLQSDEPIETLSSSNTETMRTLQSEGELADLYTTHEQGNSVVASAQSRSGMVSYVKGVDRGAVAKIENSSLVSGIPGSVKQTKRENTVHVYPNKQPMEATNLRAVVPGLSAISNPYQGHTPTPGHYDQHPQLHVRKGPHSIASSKSSQSVDRPYGAKEGAPPATMELVGMDDLKSGDYSDLNFNPDVEREDEPHQQEYRGNLVVHKEPMSTISSESFSGLHEPTSETPSYVGGKTEHGQCSSIPSSLDASPFPQQQANAGSQQQDEMRPSNLSLAGPSEVAGSSHIQQETPLESESILDYQTLLSDSHDGFRPREDGGNVPFKSYEALQIRGEERYRKVRLKFALLCPQRGQERIISDEDDYPMTSHPHGLALIINNEKFKGHDQRDGTGVDENNLTVTLRYLGYNIEIHRDVATKDMIRLFEEVKLRDHSAYDSFICCILTHGESGRVFGADSSSVLIETLTGELCAASCPSLKGKPKIFFIQACRGNLKCYSVSTDDGHHGNSGSEEGSDHDEVDHGAHPSQDSPSSNLRRAIVRSLSMEAKETAERVKADGDFPDVADFFFGFATPSGQVAWRDLDHGSWYISELCRQLCTYSVSKSLSDIMTKVHDSVGTAYQYRNYKQAPETTSRLRRKVFF